MDDPDRRALKPVLVAAIVIVALFVGLFAGYHFGRESANRDNRSALTADLNIASQKIGS